MPPGLLADQPLALATAAKAARHVGGSPGFIKEHQLAGDKLRLAVLPLRAGGLHVGAVLFAGVHGLFYIADRDGQGTG